jgi:hypothetical protein
LELKTKNGGNKDSFLSTFSWPSQMQGRIIMDRSYRAVVNTTSTA